VGAFFARSGAGGWFLSSCIPEFFGSLVLWFFGSLILSVYWNPLVATILLWACG
jgi:hypothetical protein